jgi:hypothetical protein
LNGLGEDNKKKKQDKPKKKKSDVFDGEYVHIPQVIIGFGYISKFKSG